MKKIYILLSFIILNCNKKILNLKNISKNNKAIVERINEAIHSFDNNKVKKIINSFNNIDLNELNEEGQAPLHYAIILGNIEVTQILLEKNANVNLQNAIGNTPLHLACESGNSDVAKILIAKGADPLIQDAFGQTPLVAAIVDGSNSRETLELIDCLLEHVRNPHSLRIGQNNQTLLHLACAASNLHISMLLLRKGFGINEKDSSGSTPLHQAVKNIDIELIKFLCGNNADITIKDNSFRNVQELAIQQKIYLQDPTSQAKLEEIINLFDKLGLRKEEIYKNPTYRLVLMMKTIGKVDIDEVRFETISDTLNTLGVKEDDFGPNVDQTFNEILAYTFYFRWTSDNYKASVPENAPFFHIDQNILNIQVDPNPLLDLVKNVNNEDIDEDLIANLPKHKSEFRKKILQMSSGTYKDGYGGRLAKHYLKTAIEKLPNIGNDIAKKRMVINTLLRQFAYCSTGIGEGFMAIFDLLGEVRTKGLEANIHTLLHSQRRQLLLQALRTVYMGITQQVHFDNQVTNDFSQELKIESYDDAYNIIPPYNKNLIRNKFFELYRIDILMNYMKENLTQRFEDLFDYLKEKSGQKNVHLIPEDFEIFFTEDFEIREELVKALLLKLGYIKKL